MAVVGAFMVPHPPLIVEAIGKGSEIEISKTIESYKSVARKIAELKPETIILTSPHMVMYADYFHIAPGVSGKGDFRNFGAEQVKFEISYDTEFLDELVKKLEENNFPAGTLGEKDKMLDHGSMVPIHFINQEYNEYKLVRVGISGLSYSAHYSLGEYIKGISEVLNKRVVFVASGDLSHKLAEDGPYGFEKEGSEYDQKIMQIMKKGNFDVLLKMKEDFCNKAGECGHRSFLIMAGALDRTGITAKQLSYEGPFGVGYGICEYEVNERDESRNFGEQFIKEQQKQIEKKRVSEDDYVRLARKSLESYVLSQKVIESEAELPSEMHHNKAGTFVSIKKNGQLRGCIGTTAPTRDSIAEEIIHNAISAGIHDPRFLPITSQELSELVYSVDVLGETQPIDSADELDVKRYGVIVTRGSKRGLLLPNLEGIDTVEEQIAIAKQKAGIGHDEEVQLERFEVIRHV